MPRAFHDRDLDALVYALVHNDLSPVGDVVNRLASDVDEVTRSFAMLCIAAKCCNGTASGSSGRDLRLALDDFLSVMSRFTTVAAWPTQH